MAATAMGGSNAGAATGTCAAVIMDPVGALGSSQDSLPNTTGATGGLSTGIGFGPGNPMPTRNTSVTTDPGNGLFASVAALVAGGFNDDTPPPLWRIGQAQVLTIPGFGNGGSRDDAAGGTFPMKAVTATGAVANGAVVETGWVNRCGKTLAAGNTVFGSSATVQAAA